MICPRCQVPPRGRGLGSSLFNYLSDGVKVRLVVVLGCPMAGFTRRSMHDLPNLMQSNRQFVVRRHDRFSITNPYSSAKQSRHSRNRIP
jgi:hypothetical protein